MVDDPYELILDHLRAIREKQNEHSRAISDLKDIGNRTREDVNGLRGDILRMERGLAVVENDMERIKARLDLRPE